MSQHEVIQSAEAHFEATFASSPDQSNFAPGRVNLLGEHTDYNGGVVFPMPLALGTAVSVKVGNEAGTIAMSSTSFPETTLRAMDSPPDGSWTDYIIGVVNELAIGDKSNFGLQIAVSSDLPFGAGLSSSAALEVATLRAVLPLLGKSLSDVDIALMARRAENNYVGMPCGIMDQYSVAVGEPGKAVFLDTRKLQSEVVALPASHNFVVVHSGVTHKLTEDGYEKRVEQCNAACDALGIEMLSDLTTDALDQIDQLPSPLDGRARHVVTENDRVYKAMDALKAGDLNTFSNLLTISHVSQRDDFEVSVPEVDALVEGCISIGADAARLTGGGFGGSIVAFVRQERVPAFVSAIGDKFPHARVLAVT